MKKILFIFLILPISAFADDLILSNIPNGCSSGLNTDTIMLATFAPNQYQCGSGYYVPANNDGCVVCPDVYDCNGGTYTFNEEYDQGNKFKTQVTENIRNGCKEDFLRAYNNIANITATFTPNVHNCSAGYYLPANIDECTICPLNSKCVGGNLTFNETTAQGITPCPNRSFAPTGSSVCYPHILHVGNDVVYMKSVKTTTPSLNTKINNEIFYTNMTTTPTYMNKDSTHYFKTIYNDTVYYICDDTICPNAE
jgi:hypothetical protein